MQEVGVWYMRGKERSRKIAAALKHGARAAGMRVVMRPETEYRGPDTRIAAFYGFQNTLPRIMADYLEAGRRVVFVDLGYWHRHWGGRWEGYHKVAVDGRHPSRAQMSIDRNPSRLRRLAIHTTQWKRDGRHIIVAGMSAKSAESYGLKPEEWERWAIAEIRKHSKREIVYRPKPSWRGATRLQGARYDAGPLANAFKGCHAVVTHHSNVAIDGLVSGVPAWVWDGAAVPMASQNLSRIERPKKPRDREQWLSRLAHCQWRVEEMRNGDLWRELRADGLI